SRPIVLARAAEDGGQLRQDLAEAHPRDAVALADLDDLELDAPTVGPPDELVLGRPSQREAAAAEHLRLVEHEGERGVRERVPHALGHDALVLGQGPIALLLLEHLLARVADADLEGLRPAAAPPR